MRLPYSGRELKRFDTIAPSKNVPVIIAAPRYGQAENNGQGDGRRSVDLESLTVSPLPGAVEEGRSLAALLPEATLKIGAEATETFVNQMPTPSLLHLATHGIFLPDTPGQEVVDIETSRRYEIPSENPLLRSMLALADFNSRGGQRAEDDGVFTALEASALNLYGTQLVVLSACDTGQGKVLNGEGVYGLRRAFNMAGAESLLMSLWRVEDEGTAEFMQRYYTNLLEGMGRSESLRALQLEMIDAEDNAIRHPYYWAAFVLTGDWRPLALE